MNEKRKGKSKGKKAILGIALVAIIISSVMAGIIPAIATISNINEAYVESEQHGVDTEDHLRLSAEEIGSIVPLITETGKISLSVDGLGVYPENSGTIQVEKPAGATVRGAYMAAADVWGSNGGPLPDGAIQINGNNVNWDSHNPTNANSAWSDVTTIVGPIVDAAPAGIVNLTITETINLDGSILAVIFDDPNQASDNTIVLLFGAQDVDGDTFAIGLAEPIDTSDPNLVLDMSLGISYGSQTSTLHVQYSEVDVNGVRLTSSAGGPDDGDNSNGALLTVGGLDDSNANPPDPNAHGDSTSPRYDDELYNLIPFVSNGDTAINVYTKNPSNDDNIFFAALYLASTTAVVGKGILLAPVSATNPVGSQHTVNATVQDDLGNPIVDYDVNFTIVSGPHVGLTGTDVTDANGQATWSYTGTTAGTDTIVATGATETSNNASKTWVFVDVLSVDASSFPKIWAHVSVNTSAGSAGTLTASDFEIYEDGVVQTIESFNVTGSGVTTAYHIDYTTTNPVADCTDRTVKVVVHDPVAGEDSDTGKYIAPCEEEAPTVSIDPASQDVSADDTFTVDIAVDPAGYGVSTGSITVSFDATAMQVDSVVAGDLLGISPIVPPGFPKIDNTNGTVQVDLARSGATTPPTPEGIWAAIIFTVNSDAPEETYTISITEAELADEAFADISGIITNNGTVTIVTGYPRWDINNDGTVNYIDLGILGAHYGETTETPYPRYDINEDGIVNYIDLGILGAHYGETYI